MTKQEMLDIVIPALRKQGVSAFDYKERQCMYRGPNGTKCAVGHLIPDELYYRELEEESVVSIFKGVEDGDYFENDHTELVQLLGKENLELLDDLQKAHDNGQEPWKNGFPEEEFQTVAQKYNLVYPT